MSLLIGTVTGAFRFIDALEPLIEGTRINHMAADGGGWWALDGKSRVHHDGEVVATLPEGRAALCIQPSRGISWIGSSGASLFEHDGTTVTEDEFFADAPGRSDWYTPWGDPPDVRSMALDADHTLYINVHVGGVLRYDNTGLTPVVEIEADVHQVTAHPTKKGYVYVAAAQGIGISHNGHDFEFFKDGLHAHYSRAVTVLEETVLVSASTGPRTSQGRLYRTTLDGGEFHPLSQGLPEWFDDNVDTHCLIGVEGVAYVGFGDSVWKSEDTGDNWSQVVTGLPKVTCLA